MSGDRVGITTRIPESQKQRWAEDAEELGMSQSEFVRTMVQAGRRDLGLTDSEQVGTNRAAENPDQRDATPGVQPMKGQVLGLLDRREAASWEDLVEMLTSDVEQRLDETLSELQSDGAVTHSGRAGGYVRNE